MADELAQSENQEQAVEGQAGSLRWRYPELPVSGARSKILAALEQSQVVVVVGDTGSGKTTQLPKMCLEWLAKHHAETKLVGCTQPRRIAAASVSKRVAEELGGELGEIVGYQVRFNDKTSESTRVKFMTDGILLAETQGRAGRMGQLENYGVIIIDEAHERSLNIDFLLGYLKELLAHRAELRVVISSATLDAGGFSAFFDNAPVIEVEGRTFPVEERYLEPNDREDLPRHVVRAIGQLPNEGDVLVFLPGEREIRECAEVLEGRQFVRTDILPLFARLSVADQQAIFKPNGSRRRIVLATNVAETSLTIPGIAYVIDSGVARVSRWNPNRQIQRLQVEKVSQASARQRKGRCGRVREGVCIRLYSEEDYEERAEFTDPEIRRSSLAGVILQMKCLGFPEVDEFPFLDVPSSKQVSEGYRTLREIGALNDEDRLSPMGRRISKIPVDPRLARMLIEATERACTAEMLVIVSGLSAMDVRERPADCQKEADAAHAKWDDEESDFRSMLHLWKDLLEYREGKKWRMNQLRKFCRQHYLNFKRVIEWSQLQKELARMLERTLKRPQKTSGNKEGHKQEVTITTQLGGLDSWASYETIHKVLLVGMPRQVGLYEREEKTYKGMLGRNFAVFPGSGLFGKKRHEWVLGYDMVDTSRLWARKLARVEPQWLEEVAPQLCRYRYHSAQWDKRQGAVYAREDVIMGPLTLVAQRRVHYGRIDPEASHKIFIREGLLAGGMKAKLSLIKHVDRLREEVQGMEHKLRRLEGIWSEECLIEFMEKRVPTEISTAKAFLKWLSKHEGDLKPELADVMYDDPEALGLEGYPESISDGVHEYPVYYRTAHGEADDGVTLGVHLDQLPTMCGHVAEWGVEGMLSERVDLLVRSLPKGQRIACNPFLKEGLDLEEFDRKTPLLKQLAAHLSHLTGMSIEPSMFNAKKLPPEFVTKIWVCDDDGNEVAMGTDVAELKVRLAPLMERRIEEISGEEWEQSGMSEWECGELPEVLELHGVEASVALVDEGDGVGVKVFANAMEAAKSHLQGCMRLFLMHYHDQAKYVVKNMPLSVETKMYLPLLCEGGVSQKDILETAVEGVFAEKPPRDAASFERMAEQGRGDLFELCERLCEVLSVVATSSRDVSAFIEDNLGHTHWGESAEDLQIQVRWLLRKGFVKQAGWLRMQRYAEYFQGMVTRIERMAQFPVAKDLEKMDRVIHFSEPWEEKIKAEPKSLELQAAGYVLEEFRLKQFAPKLALKGISEKMVKASM